MSFNTAPQKLLVVWGPSGSKVFLPPCDLCDLCHYHEETHQIFSLPLRLSCHLLIVKRQLITNSINFNVSTFKIRWNSSSKSKGCSNPGMSINSQIFFKVFCQTLNKLIGSRRKSPLKGSNTSNPMHLLRQEQLLYIEFLWWPTAILAYRW